MDPLNLIKTAGSDSHITRVSSIRKYSHIGKNRFHAFNITGQRMIVGCDSNIKIFNLIGQLRFVRKIELMAPVSCMTFSKNLDWFATGSPDQTIRTIRCWKEQSNGAWENTLPKQQDKKHADRVSTLILNNNEEQLISGSLDQTIMIWKVNCLTNQFEYDYILDNKHTNEVCCLSINESDTHLLSSSSSEIILWEKGQRNKWQLKTKIANFNFGVQICFISNNLFVKQQIEDFETQIYQIKNGNLIKVDEFNFKDKRNRRKSPSFPIMLNQKKVHHLMFISQLQEKGNLKVISNPINLNKDFSYGKIMENGEIFVIQCQKELRLYKIQYR